ncbi:MAG TPA: PilZ domain-containing protein, partial [Stellaceae bacterium]|nr:PilZ domain-containing protein [Stellaceae bacterium]
DFDVFELRPWLGYLHLVEVLASGRDYRYAIYGTDIAMAFGVDLTGKTLAAVPAAARPAVESAYAAVRMSGEPLFVEEDPTFQSSIERVECLILPLSTSGDTVDRLLIGTARVERSTTALAERRRAQRMPVLWPGRLERGGGWEGCVVLDYSALGARLILERAAASDDTVVIAFAHYEPLRARVAWRREEMAGVEFEERLAPRLVG